MCALSSTLSHTENSLMSLLPDLIAVNSTSSISASTLGSSLMLVREKLNRLKNDKILVAEI